MHQKTNLLKKKLGWNLLSIKQDVFVKHKCPPQQQSSNLAILV